MSTYAAAMAAKLSRNIAWYPLASSIMPETGLSAKLIRLCAVETKVSAVTCQRASTIMLTTLRFAMMRSIAAGCLPTSVSTTCTGRGIMRP